MRKFTQLVAIAALTTFSFFSCTKPGCTDDRSTNYNADANEDDNSCLYRGDITFWCLPETRDALITAGHTMLRFEIEGELVDSIATELFFSPSGDCNTAGVKTIPRDNLPYEYRYYKYRVKGSGFATIFEEFIRLETGECLGIQLEYE